MATGRKTGGRKKGTPNRATIERELRAVEGVQAALETGVLPMDVMLTVMRGGPDAEAISGRQFQAAQAAAPYVHPKLNTLRGDANAPLGISLSTPDIDRRIRELLRKGRADR